MPDEVFRWPRLHFLSRDARNDGYHMLLDDAQTCSRPFCRAPCTFACDDDGAQPHHTNQKFHFAPLAVTLSKIVKLFKLYLDIFLNFLEAVLQPHEISFSRNKTRQPPA